MDTKQVRELLRIIKQSGLEEVKIKTEELEISAKRTGQTEKVESWAGWAGAAQPQASAAAPPQPIQPTIPPVQETKPAKKEASAQKEADKDVVVVRSSMIGTFYEANSPESPPFVKVGDSIKKGQTICIIEAMKLFNEIESEVSGTVLEILVENATPVEFDQPLFKVRPN